VLVGAGLLWNLGRSRRNRVRARRGLPAKPTVSRWACEHKPFAIASAAGFFVWLLIHWALYVIDLPDG
jgi:hypothetical protein